MTPHTELLRQVDTERKNGVLIEREIMKGRDMEAREKKWTPGPWERFDQDYCPEITDGSAFEGMGHVGQNNDGMSVCQMCDDFPDVVKANAALISAAPELVEALEELKVQIQQVSDGDRPYTGFDTERMDHAIAKAYGETL